MHCRLTLLSSMTRIDPRSGPPAHRCCCDGGRGSEYEACADDPRIVREYAAREAIATSSGQNDSGLFELNFRDERYLPFEYQGAVSRWRIELPPENNYFDLDTLSDVVLHLNYTAREGGDALRARRHATPPGAGSPATACAFFDVRHDFPTRGPRRAARRPKTGKSSPTGAPLAAAGLHAGDVPVRPRPACPHHGPAAAVVRGAGRRARTPSRRPVLVARTAGHDRATRVHCRR